MDLNNVVLEIISEAEKKAEEIAESADKERSRILDEAKARARAKKEELEKGAEERIKQIRTKELAVSRMNARKIEMNAKKEAVEAVYRDFYGKIYETVDRETLLKKLFEAGKGQMEVATAYANNDDFEAAKKLFGGVDVKKTVISGGLVLENHAKTEKLDMSVETLVQNLRKETVNELWKILFGEK